jgi:antitoxin component of MazEF toxin-antitoxin module
MPRSRTGAVKQAATDQADSLETQSKDPKPATVKRSGRSSKAKSQSESQTQQPESTNSIPMATTTEAPATEETKNKIVKGERLEGDALLALVTELGDSTEEDEFIRKAGYWSQTVDESGNVISERLQSKAFYLALTAAQGIKIKTSPRSGGGRKASNYVKVAKTTCKIAVPGHAAIKAGFSEGDKVQFDVTDGQIVITLMARAADVAADQTDDETDEDEDDEF